MLIRSRLARARLPLAGRWRLPPGVIRLPGYLTVPDDAPGIVVFVHGNGSSRYSPRNRYVARILNDAGLGTLLFDLLTPGEEAARANVFDVGLLAGRLAEVTHWLRAQPAASRAPIGYFGASTGTAAALAAAAEPGTDIGAVVSRGGRPDLAGPRPGTPCSSETAPRLALTSPILISASTSRYSARARWSASSASPARATPLAARQLQDGPLLVNVLFGDHSRRSRSTRRQFWDAGNGMSGKLPSQLLQGNCGPWTGDRVAMTWERTRPGRKSEEGPCPIARSVR